MESRVKRHLARELRDSVGPSDVENLEQDPPATASGLKRVGTLQSLARQVLHNLLRPSHELQEEPEHYDTFVQKVRQLLSCFEDTTGIRAELSVSACWPPRLAADAEHNLYRIVEEGLTNVCLHSGGTSVGVRLKSAGNHWCSS